MEPTSGRAQREKGRGVVRGLHLEALEQAGQSRADALRVADEQLQHIGRLLPDALDAGLTIAEIGRITGVSRPTLYELRTKYGDTGVDFNFTLLQTVALRGPLPISEIKDRLGQSSDGLTKHLQPFVDQGLIDIDVEQSPEGDVALAVLTARGLEQLEAWELHLAEAEEAAER